jgi:hypothetical protein
MTTLRDEKFVRLYANHLALTIRRRGKVLTLWKRYIPKQKLGEYRSFAAVERALRQFTVEELEPLT